MKTKVLELQNKINNNLGYLLSVFPIVEQVLEQTHIIMEYEVTDKKIIQWFHTNKYTLLMIDDYLERMK